MVCCQGQQSMSSKPYFTKLTATFYGYHLCSFHFPLFLPGCAAFYPSRFMSKPSVNHFSVIKWTQTRKSCRNASIIGVSSLVNQSDLDCRTHHLNLCNKGIPADRPVTSLGHQEGRSVFREGPKFFELCPEVKVSRNAVPVKELLPVRRSGQNF